MTEDRGWDALHLFLNGDIDLDALEERVIPLAFTNEYENQDLVDLIAIELVYVKDGISDEALARERLAEAIESDEYAYIVQQRRIAP